VVQTRFAQSVSIRSARQVCSTRVAVVVAVLVVSARKVGVLVDAVDRWVVAEA